MTDISAYKINISDEKHRERNGLKMNIKVKTALRVILIGVTVLPLIILVLVSALNIFDFSSDMISAETGVAGYAASAGVNNILDSYLSDARAIAASPAADKAVTDLNSVKSDINDIRSNYKENRSGILDVVITDDEGVIITDGIGSAAGTHFFAYSEEWESRKNAFISDIYTGNSEYGADIYVATAKTADESGYVSCVVDLTELVDYVTSVKFINGGMLAVTDGEKIMGNGGVGDVATSERLATVKDKIPAMITESISANYVGLKDDNFLGAYGKINNSEWVWLSLYDASRSSENVLPVFIVGLIILFALALICVLVMIIMTQKIINPMLDMIKTMKDINSGSHEQRIDTKNMSKEFEKISNTFNDLMDDAILSDELHKTVSELSDNMLFEYDFAKESMFVSDNFKEKIGLNVSGATVNNGKFIDSLMEQDDLESYKRDINQLLKSKDDVGGEYKIKDANGAELWVTMKVHCITDRLGEILRVIGVLTDITSEKTATLKLAERASYDFLSQLYNRNTFEREFQAELERNANSKVAALFLDVDDFKFINDRYSHAVGDEVIKYVADVIKSKTGETGFAGRFGGDEFVLCISDPKMIENLEVLSMDIIDDLYSGYYSASADATLNIKASIGIAVSPEHGTDGRTLIACSDTAMYFVKKNGKANYHIYDPSDEETTQGAHTL